MLMSRLKPFVILDALVTLPLFIWAIYDTFKRPASGMFWLELIVLTFAVIVMVPSLVCLLGMSLNQFAAVAFILFYLVLLVFLWFRTLGGWHEPNHATLVLIGIFLLIVKSIYGVVICTTYDT